MEVWTTESDAQRAIRALKKAKKVLSDEDYTKLKKEMIDVAMHSTKKAKIHFFEFLPE